MKKIYSKPVIEVEVFVTEDIMETKNPLNIFSYNEEAGFGGYDGYEDNFITFQNNPNNALQGIDYTTFGQ